MYDTCLYQHGVQLLHSGWLGRYTSECTIVIFHHPMDALSKTRLSYISRCMHMLSPITPIGNTLLMLCVCGVESWYVQTLSPSAILGPAQCGVASFTLMNACTFAARDSMQRHQCVIDRLKMRADMDNLDVCRIQGFEFRV